MPEELEKSASSNPIPVLVAALVCDVAALEPATAKKSLIGIFDKIFAVSFPATRPLTLYVKFTDAKGHYKMTIHYVRSKTGEKLAEMSGELNSTDPLGSIDAQIQFPPLLIPAEGRYEFQVFADSVYLGSAFLDAMLLPQSPQKEGVQ